MLTVRHAGLGRRSVLVEIQDLRRNRPARAGTVSRSRMIIRGPIVVLVVPRLVHDAPFDALLATDLAQVCVSPKIDLVNQVRNSGAFAVEPSPEAEGLTLDTFLDHGYSTDWADDEDPDLFSLGIQGMDRASRLGVVLRPKARHSHFHQSFLTHNSILSGQNGV